MGVESVSVVGTLSHADTLESSFHSPTRVLLPALESMKSKRHTSYRSYSTNVYLQNHWSTALKLPGKAAQTQIVLSPERVQLYNVNVHIKRSYHCLPMLVSTSKSRSLRQAKKKKIYQFHKLIPPTKPTTLPWQRSFNRGEKKKSTLGHVLKGKKWVTGRSGLRLWL